MAELLRLEKVSKTFSPGTPQEKKALEDLSLTLEKGVAADGALTKLMRALEPGRRIAVPVTIFLYHRERSGWKPVRAWGFEDGMVTRWELGSLDGLGSEVVIEKLEISHAGLTEQEV